tara:strand:- start:212 stop:520 length:309 start_codon:yes stop_codon:yes gene_type:complete
VPHQKRDVILANTKASREEQRLKKESALVDLDIDYDARCPVRDEEKQCFSQCGNAQALQFVRVQFANASHVVVRATQRCVVYHNWYPVATEANVAFKSVEAS